MVSIFKSNIGFALINCDSILSKAFRAAKIGVCLIFYG